MPDNTMRNKEVHHPLVARLILARRQLQKTSKRFARDPVEATAAIEISDLAGQCVILGTEIRTQALLIRSQGSAPAANPQQPERAHTL